jgi:hypothetical protein
MTKRIANTTRTLISGRKGYPPQVARFIKENGTTQIRHIKVVRTPIMTIINKLIDKLGGKTPYDKLFHLRLQVTCVGGLKFTIEKNEVISVTKSFRVDKNDGSINVPNSLGMSILMSFY